jgi:hypothetical protein
MRLNGLEDSVFMSFENVDRMAVFGIAFPSEQFGAQQPNAPKATLPQTFLDVVTKQTGRIRAS